MNKANRRVLIVVSAAALFLAAVLLGAFLLGRHAVVSEEASKWPKTPRTMTDVRGLIDNIVSFRQETIPAFVPQSGWDDELCAANIVGAVNWLLGEKRLKDASAWMFSAVNKEKLRLIHDRSQDFQIQDNKVVEIRDSAVWLSRIVSTVGHNGALTSIDCT